jgi:GT2 family glycosyltransferase
MNNSKEKIAAIVVTFNRKNLLDNCLQAILKQTKPLDSIIIIDNASTDGTPEFLKEKGYLDNPFIDYVRLFVNTGGAGGFHEGMKRGYEKGFDWLWLMDDDAMPYPNALEVLINSPKALLRDTVALASLKIDANDKIQKYHIGFFDGKNCNQQPLSPEDYKKKYCIIDYSSFVGFLIKKNVITKVGFPNKDFFIWYDDIEFCLRLKRIGLIYFVRDSIILHYENDTKEINRGILPIWADWKRYYGIRNHIYILRNYFAKSLISIGIFILLKLFIKILLFADRKGLRILFLIKAVRDGLHGKLGKRVNPETWNI